MITDEQLREWAEDTSHGIHWRARAKVLIDEVLRLRGSEARAPNDIAFEKYLQTRTNARIDGLAKTLDINPSSVADYSVDEGPDQTFVKLFLMDGLTMSVTVETWRWRANLWAPDDRESKEDRFVRLGYFRMGD